MGRGFTSGGQESGCVFGGVVCQTQSKKHYIEALPLKIREAGSLKVEGPLYSCLFTFALQKWNT